MHKCEDNLLVALSKWAPNQQENYLTEAFAYLLRHLQRAQPGALSSFLGRLTDGAVELLTDMVSEIRITTQVTIDGGRLDIEIAGPDVLVYIEVKDQSDVDKAQLRRYSDDLASRTQQLRCLVLVTRRAPGSLRIPLLKPPIRWPEIYRWLEELVHRTQDEVTQYLVGEFRGLLGGLGMAVDKVGWELVPGLSAALNLRRMLREALEE